MPCLPPAVLLAEISAARAREDDKEEGARDGRKGGEEEDGGSSCDRNHLSLGSGDSDDSALDHLDFTAEGSPSSRGQQQGVHTRRRRRNCRDLIDMDMDR